MDEDDNPIVESSSLLISISTISFVCLLLSFIVALFAILVQSDSIATTLNRAGSLLQIIAAIPLLALLKRLILPLKSMIQNDINEIKKGAQGITWRWRTISVVIFGITIALLTYGLFSENYTYDYRLVGMVIVLILILGIVTAILEPALLPLFVYKKLNQIETSGLNLIAASTILLVAAGALLQFLATFY